MNSAEGSIPEHDDGSRRRPGAPLKATSLSSESVEPISKLARRIERTYLSRLQMARRLQRRGAAWNAALIALSSSAAISSIPMLGDAQIYGSRGVYIFAVISILTLVASLLVANAGYQDKARHAFENYRQLQRLAVQSEVAAADSSPGLSTENSGFTELDKAYQQLLDRSDNHSQADYATAIKIRLESHRQKDYEPLPSEDFLTWPAATLRWVQRVGQVVVTGLPVLLMALAVVFSVPSILWMLNGF